MPTPIEREIFIKAARGHELLRKALETFGDYMKAEVPASSPDYYRARNLLKEGRVFCEDALREAKKLLGPVPIYAPREYEAMRAKALEENRIVVRGEDPADLVRQLAEDATLRAMMTEGEIEAYVRDRFEAQKQGKRKLANIKVRMMLDRLFGLAADGLAAQRAAQRKQQGLPPE